MKNILFKVSFPAEFHAQTAVECALALHPQARDRIDEIARIRIDTQESAARIISKTGPLHNPADRDHCLQYMVACGLIFGDFARRPLRGLRRRRSAHRRLARENGGLRRAAF